MGQGRLNLPSENERMILDIVRRSGSLPRAAIASRTNLTQQSVHRIIDALTADGMLKLGEALIRGPGKPSPQLTLRPEACYSVGVSLNTDEAAFCIVDFACRRVHEETLDAQPYDRAATLARLKARIDSALEGLSISQDRLAGVGFAIAGYFVGPGRQVNAPEPLQDWSLIDLHADLETLFGTRVWIENNGTTGAIGESVLGAGLEFPTFGYLSFNYGFGGGVVIDGKAFAGSFGNAGEISRIFTVPEVASRPALGELIRRLKARGMDIETIRALRTRFRPDWPGVAEWVEEVTPQLRRAIDALRAVIDPAAIVFGGELPPELGRLLISVPPSPEEPRYGRTGPYPQLVLSRIEGDPAVIGAALIPLKTQYFL